MQIRITTVFIQLGSCIQCTRGEVVDLPAKVAQPLIDAGEAVALTKAERAVLRHRPTIAGFVPPTPQKATLRA